MQRRKLLILLTLSGLFIKHFEEVIENDSIHNLAKDILNIIHCRKENTIKNLINHLKYGKFGQSNTTVQSYQLKVLLWICFLLNWRISRRKLINMIKSTVNLCPVKILQNYFNFALINDKSDEQIFRAITKTKTTEKLRNVNNNTRTRELLLEALVDIVL